MRRYLGNLKRFVAGMTYMCRNMTRQSDEGFRVLLYHSIVDEPVGDDRAQETTSKQLFEQQMRYLAEERYNVISCSQALGYLLHGQQIPPRTIAITFDDGYMDNYTNALPVLERYNLCATMFITVDLLRDFLGDSRRLGTREILDAAKSGVVDFGCHGCSHRILTSLPADELEKEIRGARQRLQDMLNDEVELFAYPFGHNRSYNEAIIKMVKSAGFTGAFTSTFGLNGPGTDPYLMRRNRISWFDELDGFKKHLLGAYDWYALRQSVGKKRSEVLDILRQRERL